VWIERADEQAHVIAIGERGRHSPLVPESALARIARGGQVEIEMPGRRLRRAKRERGRRAEPRFAIGAAAHRGLPGKRARIARVGVRRVVVLRCRVRGLIRCRGRIRRRIDLDWVSARRGRKSVGVDAVLDRVLAREGIPFGFGEGIRGFARWHRASRWRGPLQGRGPERRRSRRLRLCSTRPLHAARATLGENRAFFASEKAPHAERQAGLDAHAHPRLAAGDALEPRIDAKRSGVESRSDGAGDRTRGVARE